MGQHLSGYHAVFVARAAVYGGAVARAACGRVAAGGVSAGARAARLGQDYAAGRAEYRAVSGDAVCGGVSAHGRAGGNFNVHANADGAAHLAGWRADAAESGVGLGGGGLLVLSPTARLDGLGVAAALAGSAAMALGVYLSKHWQIKLSGAAFTGWQLVAGGLFLLPITLWREGVPHHLTAANAGGYAYLCLVGAVLAYGLFFRGLARLSPAAVSSLGLLSPVSAFVLGWLFLGQALDARSMVGLVLALVSIAGIQRAMR